MPPKSFFPQPRPVDLITVPTCPQCNQGFTKDEQLFLSTFMFSAAGNSEVGRALWSQKLGRVYSKDIGLRRRIAKSLGEAESSTPAGIYLGRVMTIKPDIGRSEQFVEKIVRGLYRHEFKRALAPNTKVDSVWLRLPSDGRQIEKFRDELLLGSRNWPGIFEYRFNRVQETPEDSMWVIRFFGKIVFFCTSAGSSPTNRDMEEAG